jgi:hypothetical protein
MLLHLEPLIKLAPQEEKEFARFIKTQREKMILPLKETAKIAMLKNKQQIEEFLYIPLVSEELALSFY